MSSATTTACEVKLDGFCGGKSAGRFTGDRKGDPVFDCCLQCFAMLRRQGVKLKRAPVTRDSTARATTRHRRPST